MNSSTVIQDQLLDKNTKMQVKPELWTKLASGAVKALGMETVGMDVRTKLNIYAKADIERRIAIPVCLGFDKEDLPAEWIYTIVEGAISKGYDYKVYLCSTNDQAINAWYEKNHKLVLNILEEKNLNIKSIHAIKSNISKVKKSLEDIIVTRPEWRNTALWKETYNKYTQFRNSHVLARQEFMKENPGKSFPSELQDDLDSILKRDVESFRKRYKNKTEEEVREHILNEAVDTLFMARFNSLKTSEFRHNFDINKLVKPRVTSVFYKNKQNGTIGSATQKIALILGEDREKSGKKMCYLTHTRYELKEIESEPANKFQTLPINILPFNNVSPRGSSNKSSSSSSSRSSSPPPNSSSNSGSSSPETEMFNAKMRMFTDLMSSMLKNDTPSERVAEFADIFLTHQVQSRPEARIERRKSDENELNKPNTSSNQDDRVKSLVSNRGSSSDSDIKISDNPHTLHGTLKRSQSDSSVKWPSKSMLKKSF